MATSSSDVHKGDRVRLIRQASVMTRFPELVGAHGRVMEVPSYPNTWYAVKIEAADSPEQRIVKVQSKSMVVLGERGTSKSQSHTASAAGTGGGGSSGGGGGGTTIVVPGSAASAKSRQGSTPRSRTSSASASPRRSSASPRSKALPVGTVVRIRDTASTASRAPSLVGCIGVVVVQPQHPKTWYSVKFTKNQARERQHTFRLSALEEVEPDHPDAKNAAAPAASSTATGASTPAAPVKVRPAAPASTQVAAAAAPGNGTTSTTGARTDEELLEQYVADVCVLCGCVLRLWLHKLPRQLPIQSTKGMPSMVY